MLLEKLNTACACESERLDKRKQLVPHLVAVHAAQTNGSPIERKEKVSAPQNNPKVQLDILSELKEMRSNMTLLSDVKAEVSQIKEFMQKPQLQVQPEQSLSPVTTPMAVPPAMLPPMPWSSPYVHQNPQYGYMTPRRFAAPSPRRRRRCFSCQQNNIGDCRHCYACGSNEHFLAGCRMRGARQSHPLNGQGSLQRDQQ